ncbi:MAG: helix-hairpin-helix domain-containing protein, partial [Candidatus Hermodarchaeota archaeon]
EEVFEDNIEIESENEPIPDESTEEVTLLDVKGIGEGTVRNLESQGINSIQALLDANPEEFAPKINGVSVKKFIEWQTSAKSLMQS